MVEFITVMPCSTHHAKNTYLKACISHATPIRTSILAETSAQIIYGALKNIVQGSEHCR